MSLIDTFASADDLLAYHLKKSTSSNPTDLQVLKKQFIQDSFKVNRFHKIYKKWENSRRDNFIHQEIEPYNAKLGKLTRVSYDNEILQREHEKLEKQINLPNFSFARATLESYNDGELLTPIEEEVKGLKEINLTKIFSLKVNGKLPNPDFETFKELLSIELRLRVQRRIKYEVLLIIKQQLTANNKKWATRDSALNEFMRKLENVTEEVENIRKSERDDLKDFEDYLMDEEEELEEDEENEETGEVNEEGEGEGESIKDEKEETEEAEGDGDAEFVGGGEESEGDSEGAEVDTQDHSSATDNLTEDAAAEDDDDELMAIDS